MKIYDCFTFYNEFELLELRLKSLWDAVDYFVIVEANRKHTGDPKTFNFWTRIKDFRDFLPKIRFVPADLSNVPFKGVGDWSIENAQRNAILNGIGDAEPDDLIMVSDLDEIPAPSFFADLQENRIPLIYNAAVQTSVENRLVNCPAQLLVSAKDFLEVGAIAMKQTFHYYYFDLASKTLWSGTVIAKRKNLTTPQRLRDSRGILPYVSGGGESFLVHGRSGARDKQNDFDC